MLSEAGVQDVKKRLVQKGKPIGQKAREAGMSVAKYQSLMRQRSRNAKRKGSRGTAAARRASQRTGNRTRARTQGMFTGLRSKAARMESITSHSREFIDTVIDYVVETGEVENGAKMLEASPRLTSTKLGRFVLEALSRIEENERIRDLYYDMEIADGSPVFYFAKGDKGSEIEEEATEVLSAFGDVDVVAKPGDRMGEGIVSDFYVIAISPTNQQIEAFYDEVIADLTEENEAIDKEQVMQAAKSAAEKVHGKADMDKVRGIVDMACKKGNNTEDCIQIAVNAIRGKSGG